MLCFWPPELSDSMLSGFLYGFSPGCSGSSTSIRLKKKKKNDNDDLDNLQ